MKLSAPVAELSRMWSPSSQPPNHTRLSQIRKCLQKQVFSGFLGDCAVEKFLKNTEGSCKLNELVSVVDLNSFHRNIEEVRDLNEPETARLPGELFSFYARRRKIASATTRFFYVFTLKQKKNMFSLAESPKTREMRFQDVA